MKYLKYLRYVLRHRWYVFIECCKMKIYWRGIIHDLSKFLPDEFIPYANYFYGKSSKKQKRDDTGYYVPYETGDGKFDFAWLLHQKRNKHHWQYWVLIRDNDDNKGEYVILNMPLKYRKEMLADWRGAGKAQGFGNNTKEWYEKNKDKMKLHPSTRRWLEKALRINH